MQPQVALATGQPGAEGQLLSLQSDTEAYAGHFTQAGRLSESAYDSGRRRNGVHEAAAGWLLKVALREAEVGESAKAREDVASALNLASSRGLETIAAWTLACAGASRSGPGHSG